MNYSITRPIAALTCIALLASCATPHRRVSAAEARQYPQSIPTAESPDWVISPYSGPYKQRKVDVLGVPKGSLVRDPNTGREFLYTGESYASWKSRQPKPPEGATDYGWLIPLGFLALAAAGGSSGSSNTDHWGAMQKENQDNREYYRRQREDELRRAQQEQAREEAQRKWSELQSLKSGGF